MIGAGSFKRLAAGAAFGGTISSTTTTPSASSGAAAGNSAAAAAAAAAAALKTEKLKFIQSTFGVGAASGSISGTTLEESIQQMVRKASSEALLNRASKVAGMI